MKFRIISLIFIFCFEVSCKQPKFHSNAVSSKRPKNEPSQIDQQYHAKKHDAAIVDNTYHETAPIQASVDSQKGYEVAPQNQTQAPQYPQPKPKEPLLFGLIKPGVYKGKTTTGFASYHMYANKISINHRFLTPQNKERSCSARLKAVRKSGRNVGFKILNTESYDSSLNLCMSDDCSLEIKATSTSSISINAFCRSLNMSVRGNLSLSQN